MTGKKEKGSLTIEASMVYPLFLMIIVTILFLMRIVYTYGLIQHAVSQTAKELSMYSYIYQIAGIGDINQNIQGAVSGRTEQFNSDVENVISLYESFGSGDGNVSYQGTTSPTEMLKNIGGVLLGEGAQELNDQFFLLVVKPLMEGYIGADSKGNSADKRLEALRVVGGMDGLDFSASSFFADGSTVDLIVCYTVDPLFPIDIMPEMNLANRAKVRGMRGKNVFTGQEAEGGSGEKESIWDKSPAERGKLIQEQQNVRNLPDQFPAFSAFDPATGTATAEVSIDLRAKSYQTTAGIVGTIRSQCSDMENYRTSTREQVTVNEEETREKVLIVYIASSTGDRTIDRSAYDQAVNEVQEAYPDIRIVTKEID